MAEALAGPTGWPGGGGKAVSCCKWHEHQKEWKQMGKSQAKEHTGILAGGAEMPAVLAAMPVAPAVAGGLPSLMGPDAALGSARERARAISTANSCSDSLKTHDLLQSWKFFTWCYQV